MQHAIKVPAASTIHGVLDRHGLVRRLTRPRTRAEGTPLSDSLNPNDLWATDSKGEFQLGDRRYCYPLQREAQVLAALNHPNIAQIYEAEDSVLAMELVEGPTLAERMQQGVIPLEETLEITCQIAEALESAHERGIVHHDLKPANIKIKPGGTVKVLDFGLAAVLHTTATGATDPGRTIAG